MTASTGLPDPICSLLGLEPPAQFGAPGRPREPRQDGETGVDPIGQDGEIVEPLRGREGGGHAAASKRAMSVQEIRKTSATSIAIGGTSAAFA